MRGWGAALLFSYIAKLSGAQKTRMVWLPGEGGWQREREGRDGKGEWRGQGEGGEGEGRSLPYESKNRSCASG